MSLGNDVAYALIGFIVRTVILDTITTAWRKRHDRSHEYIEKRLDSIELLLKGGDDVTDNDQKIGELVPAMQSMARSFLQRAALAGYDLRITEAYRTPERQDEYYTHGRTKLGKVITNVKGNSPYAYHVQRRAFDVVDRNHGYEIDWATLGKIGKGCGLSWGGDFPILVDRPHFQYLGAATILESVPLAQEEDVDLLLEQFKAIYLTWFTVWPGENEISAWRTSGKLPWQYMQDVYINPALTELRSGHTEQYQVIDGPVYRKIN